MSSSKNIVFISASPKIGEESVSAYLVSMLEKQMESEVISKTSIDVRQSFTKQHTQSDFEVIAKADAIVIVFPLYIFCLPSLLTRFLEDYFHYFCTAGQIKNGQKGYAVVNCGFPEPEINREAVRVIASFSRHIKADYRFGILIGGGGMLHAAKNAPFLKKTLGKLETGFDKIKTDFISDNQQSVDDFIVSVNFPRKLYFFMANRGFMSMAHNNGLAKKDLFRQPYLTG